MSELVSVSVIVSVGVSERGWRRVAEVDVYGDAALYVWLLVYALV